MIRPRPLKKGDRIGLIAASSPTKPDRIEPSIKAMEELGFEVVLGKSCRCNHGYLSGSDEIRANDINKMFDDKTIKGIFAIRGDMSRKTFGHAGLQYDKKKSEGFCRV